MNSEYNDPGWDIDNDQSHMLWLPKDIDLHSIITTVAASHLSCPKEQVGVFAQQVAYARNHYHIDLSAVYISDAIESHRTLFRDIADYVSHYHHGTIIVFNKENLGIESDVYSRDIIETSSNALNLSKTDEIIIPFARNLAGPHLPWNSIVPIALVLIIIFTAISQFLWVHYTKIIYYKK